MDVRDTIQPAIVAVVAGDKVASPTASPTYQVQSDKVNASSTTNTGNSALIAGLLAGTFGLLCCVGIPLFVYFRQESKRKQKRSQEKGTHTSKVFLSKSTVAEEEKDIVLVQLSQSDLHSNFATAVKNKSSDQQDDKEEAASFANYYDLFTDNDKAFDDGLDLYSNMKKDSEDASCHNHYHNPLLMSHSNGNRGSLEHAKNSAMASDLFTMSNAVEDECASEAEVEVEAEVFSEVDAEEDPGELFTLYNVAEEDGESYSEARTGENPQHHRRKATAGVSDSERSPDYTFNNRIIDGNTLITSSRSTPLRPPRPMCSQPMSDPVGLRRSKLLSRSSIKSTGSSESDDGGTHFVVDREMPHSQRFRVIQTKFEYMIQKNSRTRSRASSPMERESSRDSGLMTVSLEKDGTRSRTGSFSNDRNKVFSSSTERDVSL